MDALARALWFIELSACEWSRFGSLYWIHLTYVSNNMREYFQLIAPFWVFKPQSAQASHLVNGGVTYHKNKCHDWYLFQNVNHRINTNNKTLLSSQSIDYTKVSITLVNKGAKYRFHLSHTDFDCNIYFVVYETKRHNIFLVGFDFQCQRSNSLQIYIIY